MSADFALRANVVDIPNKTIRPGTIWVANGRIERVAYDAAAPDPALPYALPGFVDAHVHVESSLLVPAEFARLAVVHGTVATVSDPHEIGNVLGVAGVEFMLDNARQSPFHFCFGAPSCVPATVFETAGATITADDIEQLFQRPEIGYLAEMMNWPGVLHHDADVMRKIALARQYGRPVDGHAPGLRGDDARRYAAAGMSTDHECFTADEALDKLACGMHILIREGSAARNFEALVDLLHEYSAQIMFCSDDKHPDSLVLNHIDELVRRAVARGIEVWKVLQAACLNPVQHYRLDLGQLREGDAADFIAVDNLQEFRVQQTYLRGQLVAEQGRALLPPGRNAAPNNFVAQPLQPADFALGAPSAAAATAPVRAIRCYDGQLITAADPAQVPVQSGLLVPDVANDVLKLTVVNRYQPHTKPAVAFIRGFGLQRGALASSVGHDSHNITAVGCSDEAIARAVNLVIAAKGGLAAVGDDGEELLLPLPVAGLMSDGEGYAVAEAYTAVDQLAKHLGSPLRAPFMTLSFMALLVIPALKLSDKGLFDGEKFEFVPVLM
ncbi:adenine deaminase [Hymenobacter oligotrophus]|uniref:Adenine deaminase n=1 Tax=Hymenobacter oligotrophus TaxID=2319843 RepID=A0A3B7QW26_9BACT|nr:adenine deaminase [Hymenobacter oligotrophus]AYA37308.1 adenine deaminase [Hymenobacter oligotrophus]